MLKKVWVTVNTGFNDFDKEYENIESLDRLVDHIKSEYVDENYGDTHVTSLVITVSL